MTAEDTLKIWILERGRYGRRHDSIAIPILNDKLISGFMESSLTMKRPAWSRQMQTNPRPDRVAFHDKE